MSRNALIGLIVVAVVAVAAYHIIRRRQAA